VTAARLTGPIRGGRHGWPFGSAAEEIAAYDYIEEEWFLDGEAAAYDLVAGTEATFDGRWTAQVTGSFPYRTRMVVRRPADPVRANGTVVIGWNNVTAGVDLDGQDLRDPGFFAAGFTAVDVTCQTVGVHGFTAMPAGLQAWDAERYATLTIPSDDASYDIFTQAARAVGPGLLGGIAVERLIATGASQSAARLLSYLNAIQPLEAVFDAFLLTVHWGCGAPVSTGGAGPLATMMDLISEPWDYRRHRTRLRTDLVPVFVVNSETETTSCAAVRQPDDERYRFWEIAGSAHTGGEHLFLTERLERDMGGPLPGTETTLVQPNDLDTRPVFAAARDHLQRWLVEGVAPPSFPPIELAGDPPEIVRDADGVAAGGVRLPDVRVPVALLTATTPEQGWGSLTGSREAFDAATLRARYGDRDGYLAQYDRAVDEAVEDGIVPAAAASGLRDAARARTLAFED